MKVGNAQFIVLGELIVLLLLESTIMNKLITVSRLAFIGSASTPVTNSSSASTSAIPQGVNYHYS